MITLQSPCSNFEPFVLRVHGDEMAPGIPDGSIITIDPGGAIYDGAFVVARIEEQLLLRQLRMSNAALLVTVPGNVDDEPAEIERSCILGVVTQSTDSRRRRIVRFSTSAQPHRLPPDAG